MNTTHILSELASSIILDAFAHFGRLLLRLSQHHFVKGENVALKARMRHVDTSYVRRLWV